MIVVDFDELDGVLASEASAHLDGDDLVAASMHDDDRCGAAQRTVEGGGTGCLESRCTQDEAGHRHAVVLGEHGSEQTGDATEARADHEGRRGRLDDATMLTGDAGLQIRTSAVRRLDGEAGGNQGMDLATVRSRFEPVTEENRHRV